MADDIRLLVLFRAYTKKLSYYDDWMDAFRAHSAFAAELENIDGLEGDLENLSRVRKKIGAAPFVVLLHSTNADGIGALTPLVSALQGRVGKLAVFMGNEVNLPLAPMAEKFAFLQQVEPELILTQLLEETGQWFYAPIAGARVRCITHALNPDVFRPGPPLGKRKIDIGARSHWYGPFVGDLDRVVLHQEVRDVAERLGLNVDIQLGGERFDRRGWAAFLGACRATISTEAGSAFLERDDALLKELQATLQRRGPPPAEDEPAPATLPQRVVRGLLPLDWRIAIYEFRQRFQPEPEPPPIDTSLDAAEIGVIQREIFTPARRSPKYTKCVSSRHFDAVGTKTVQVLLDGRYNDILMPGRHFIEVKQDFSNLESVLVRLKDIEHCNSLVGDAYDCVMSAHLYSHRMDAMERELAQL